MGWEEGEKGQEILRSNVVGVLIIRGKVRGVVYMSRERGGGVKVLRAKKGEKVGKGAVVGSG